MDATPGHCAKIRRTSFALAFALAVVAQVGGVLHLGLVRHERCPEHGELVEPSADDGHGPTTETDEAHDEHCPLALAPGIPATPPSLLAGAVLESPLEVTLWRSKAAPRPIEVLAVAPKTSPPAPTACALS